MSERKEEIKEREVVMRVQVSEMCKGGQKRERNERQEEIMEGERKKGKNGKIDL
jgi:hypothetical protein